MSFPQQTKQIGHFSKNVGVTLGVGILSSILTSQAMQQFTTINKPSLSPPAIVFPIVWIILYTLMGISLYLIEISGEGQSIIEARRIFWLQLLVNFLWPTFFFNFQWYLFSLSLLILLWILVLIMIVVFEKILPIAAYLNIPYLIWLTFAAYLNLAIFMLN